MGVLSNLIVRIAADTNDYDRKLTAATRKLERLGSDFAAIGTKLSVGISLPLIGVGVAALNVAAQMETTKLSFETMLGSAQKAGKFLGELKEFALATPFQFMELADASKRMLALGFETQKVIPTLRAIGGAVAALGGGKELMDRVTLALGQMLAKGKVQAEEMRQMAEAGIPAWEILAKKLNTDVAGAMKLVEKRLVDSRGAVDAFAESMRTRFGGAFDRFTETFRGQMEKLQEEATFALDAIGQTLLPTAKRYITEFAEPAIKKTKELAEGFANLSPGMQDFTIKVLAFTAAAPLAIVALGTITSNAAVLVRTLQAFTALNIVAHVGVASQALSLGLTGALLQAERASLALAIAWRALPFVALAIGIHKVTSALADHGTKIDTTAEKVKELNKTWGFAMTGRPQSTGPIPSSITGFIDELDKGNKKVAESTALIGAGAEKAAKAMKAMPFAEKSKEAALLVAEFERLEKVQKDLLEDVVSMRAAGGGSILDMVPPTLAPDLEGVSKAVQKIARDSQDAASAASGAAEQLQKMADARADFERVAMTERGKKDLEQYKDIHTKGIPEALKKSEQAAKRFYQQVSTVVTDLSRGLADAIVQAKSLGEVFVRVARNIAAAIIRVVIEGAIMKLANHLAGLTGILGKLGGILGGAAGGAASAAASVGASAGVSAAGSVAGSAAGSAGASAAGGVASGVAGIASMGLMGTLGAVGSIGSMVSGFIGNFQMKGMNKSLDLIEKATRFMESYLLNIVGQLQTGLGFVANSNEYLWTVQQPALAELIAAAQGGGGTYHLNFTLPSGDPRAVATEVVRTLKQHGILPKS